MSVGAGAVYFAYGDALLSKVGPLVPFSRLPSSWFRGWMDGCMVNRMDASIGAQDGPTDRLTAWLARAGLALHTPTRPQNSTRPLDQIKHKLTNTQVEESADLFGEGVQKAEAAKQEGQAGEGGDDEEEEDVEDEEEGEGGAAASSSAAAALSAASSAEGEGGEEGEARVAISEEAQDDLEVAWENLEAARVIYTKHEAEVCTYVIMCASHQSIAHPPPTTPNNTGRAEEARGGVPPPGGPAEEQRALRAGHRGLLRLPPHLLGGRRGGCPHHRRRT